MAEERCSWCGWRVGADAPNGEKHICAETGETICVFCFQIIQSPETLEAIKADC